MVSPPLLGGEDIEIHETSKLAMLTSQQRSATDDDVMETDHSLLSGGEMFNHCL